MTNAERQALAIYEMICATSGGRPLYGYSVEQLSREMADWKARNPALAELSRAEPRVQLAFLSQSFEWLRAEALVNGNDQVCQTMWEAIELALTEAPKPLPAELVRRLLSDYCQDLASMTHIYFPFGQLLSILTRDQVTDEIRAELRKRHLHFAPSPTGKIGESTQQTRELIAELIRVEGEKELDPGRGPWSQSIFDDIKVKDEISRSGWEALLEHCRNLEQTVPGAKWKKRSWEIRMRKLAGQLFVFRIKWISSFPQATGNADCKSGSPPGTGQRRHS